jgi:hypothetical protein
LRFVLRMAEVIDDFVLENSHKPGSFLRPSDESVT